MPNVTIAQDAAADELLGRDPLALLIGMLLDPHMGRRTSGVGRGQVVVSLLRGVLTRGGRASSRGSSLMTRRLLGQVH